MYLLTQKTKKRIKQFISFYREKGLPCFVMMLKDTNDFIGRCGFGPLESGEVEVGYVISKKFWGMGYASEALKSLLEWSRLNIKKEHIIIGQMSFFSYSTTPTFDP